MIAPSLEAMGYDIVRVLLAGKQRLRLQILVERRDGAGIGVDDCVSVSRAVAAILDVEDPISGSYELEVSSPGIDRPLTRLSDFARFVGHAARIEAAFPIDGRRRWTGRILGLDGEEVQLEFGDGKISVPYTAIARAKLVLNDELIAARGVKSGSGTKGQDE